MVGAPNPGVIDDGVVGVDAKVDNGAAHACSTNAEEYIGELNRVVGVIRVAALRADFDEHRRFLGASIDEKAGDDHAVRVGSGESGGAMGGLERGEAEAKDNRARGRDANRLGEFVDAGSE